MRRIANHDADGGFAFKLEVELARKWRPQACKKVTLAGLRRPSCHGTTRSKKMHHSRHGSILSVPQFPDMQDRIFIFEDPMAYATLTFENPHTGGIKQAPVGFSWTTFFFGIFPALFRGHVIGAVIQFILAFMTLGLSHFIFAFIYNKMYIKHLIGEGYKVQSASMDPNSISNRLGLRLPLLAA
jgi:hypothetical protein